MKYIILAFYILFAQTAVLLVKTGSAGAAVTLESGNLSVSVSVRLLVGLCLYVCSFLLWIVVLSQNDLSRVTPFITGANYIIPMVIGIFLLKETMTTPQWIGAFVILTGLVISNIRVGAG